LLRTSGIQEFKHPSNHDPVIRYSFNPVIHESANPMLIGSREPVVRKKTPEFDTAPLGGHPKGPPVMKGLL
jgi:hypothetical protein